MQTIEKREIDDDLRKRLLAYEQRYDVQTGFLNHQAFHESLTGWMRTNRPRQEIALVWIEVLNLRREFALLGYKGIETLVTQVAEAVRSAVDDDALLGRFSARCFLVALRARCFDKTERRRIQAIADVFSSLRILGSHNNVEAAAGVAFWPSDTDSTEDLVRFASLAASRAVYLRSNSVLTFRSSMNHSVLQNHMLELEMHRAFDQDQFSLVYQPRVDLRTGQIGGVEALIRWDHPTWGRVSPSKFIPIAERSDLIQRVLQFTLRRALVDATRWNERNAGLPVVSLNVSWSSMHRDDFIRSVQSALAEMPLGATELEMEVTESVLFDNEELFATRVRQLRAIGVRVAIDDFGTRYTGFNVLRRVPLDAMKIDRCFIKGIDRSPDMRALCEAIVIVARNLKLRTVAEGVEERDELNVLRDIGCDEAQGFLFERALVACDVVEFLQNWPSRLSGLGIESLQPE